MYNSRVLHSLIEIQKDVELEDIEHTQKKNFNMNANLLGASIH